MKKLRHRVPAVKYIIGATFFCAMFAQSFAQETRPFFDLLHLWKTQAEQNALEALRAQMTKNGVEWSEQVVSTNFKGVRTEFAERSAVGVQPSGVVWIGDKELRHLIEEGRMRLIPNEVNGIKFSELLRDEVYKIVELGSGITSLPIGLHLQNNAVYNIRHLKAVGREIPKSWAEFIDTARLLKEHGYVPLSMSTEAWQMRPLILSILSEQLPPAEFEDVFVNNYKLGKLRDKLIPTFNILKELRKYANEDFKDLNWQTSVFKVRDNEATANFLGDFNSPMIENNPDVVCAAPPGNTYIVWSFDTAVLSKPKNQAQQIGQDEFIKVATIPKVQQQFVAAKGGLSVFKNLETDNFLRCSEVSTNRWNNSKHKFHLAGGAWSQHLSVITNVAKNFWEEEDQEVEKRVDKIIQAIKHLYEFEKNEDN